MRLFGRISTPSTADRGVAAFRESLLEYPASRTAWPERDSGQTTRETSGLSLQGSFGMLGPDGSSSKTSPESLATTLSASGPNYQRWVTALRRSSSRRRKLGLPTGGNDSSSWRSPDAPGQTGGPRSRTGSVGKGHQVTTAEPAEHWPTPRTITGGGESGERKAELGRTESGGGDLQAAVAMWPTPRSEDSESAGNHPGASDSLTGVTGMWPTPAAMTTGAGSEGRDGGDNLQTSAEHWNTPRVGNHQAADWATPLTLMLWRQASERFLPATADVETGSPAGETGALPVTHGDTSSVSAPPSRRQLNPRFVSWLMGWDPLWTSLAPLNCGSPGMESSLPRPHTPSGSSNWPTPDTMNARWGGGHMRAEAKGAHAMSLHHAVEGWES